MAHYVTVEHVPATDDTNYGIECTDPASCNGWQECFEPHETDRGGPLSQSGDKGPWNAAADAPWAEEDEWTFHGVPHTWRSGWGWTADLPAHRCPVLEADIDYSDFTHLPDGRHEVEEEWDDGDLYLTPVVNHG